VSFLNVPLYCAAAVQAALLIATLVNYFRTKARPYLFFALSFLFAIGTISLVILLVNEVESASFMTNGNGLVMIYAELGALISACFGELAAALGILSLLGSWFSSTKTVLGPRAASGPSIVMILRVVFILCASAAALILALGVVTMSMLILWFYIACAAYFLTQVFLFGYVIWILIDSNLSHESLRTKKKQLWLIFGLVLLTPLVAIVVRYAGLVIWFLRCIIIVWPKALSGFEQPPPKIENQPVFGYQQGINAAMV